MINPWDLSPDLKLIVLLKKQRLHMKALSMNVSDSRTSNLHRAYLKNWLIDQIA